MTQEHEQTRSKTSEQAWAHTERFKARGGKSEVKERVRRKLCERSGGRRRNPHQEAKRREVGRITEKGAGSRVERVGKRDPRRQAGNKEEKKDAVRKEKCSGTWQQTTPLERGTKGAE